MAGTRPVGHPKQLRRQNDGTTPGNGTRTEPANLYAAAKAIDWTDRRSESAIWPTRRMGTSAQSCVSLHG
jgi:hypothetical protein